MTEPRPQSQPGSARRKQRHDLVKVASRALSDLNMFYAVIALMEGSLISSDHQAAESRIVKICQAEAQKCLVRYDRADAELSDLRP